MIHLASQKLPLYLGAKLPLNGIGHYPAITDYTIFLLSYSTESYLANSK